MSDRPSRHPTGKVVLPDIPRAPRAPQGLSALAPSLPEEDDDPSSSLPTVPPPATFSQIRQMSAHPSAVPAPPSNDDPRGHDSRSFTLPGPDSVPRLLVDLADQSWFDIGDDSRALLALVDGTRSVGRIATDHGISPREAQLRIADLRDRGIIEL